MQSYIHSHNNKNLNKMEQNNLTCNRRNCPMPNTEPPNNCRQTEVVYEGKIRLQDENENGTNDTIENYMKTYKGCTKTELKARIATHRNTFNDPEKRTNTEMAKEIHKLKDENKNFLIQWTILEKIPCFKPGDKYCKLCTLEKYYIIFKKSRSDLNKFRLEKCKHKQTAYLGSVT